MQEPEEKEPSYEGFDEQSVVRQHNRALRSVNRGLRRQTERLKIHSDELFIALCDTDTEAEQAFRELWESGGFQPPIGPRDYPEIVERCLAALREYNERHTSLADSVPVDADWQQP